MKKYRSICNVIKMRKNYLLLLLTLKYSIIFGQIPLIQNGVVRELNSGKKLVSDVQIIFSDAVPTTSDQEGKFRLAFKDKKAGDLVFLKEVSKNGYELVNLRELETVKLSNNDLFNNDIIIAKKGSIDVAKKQYYAVSDKALKLSFEKEKSKLKIELQNLRVSTQQYQIQYDSLQKQYDSQRKELDILSEKFAKFNYDDVSVLVKEALQLFKSGKIDEAIQVLENANLINKSDAISEQQAKLFKNQLGIFQSIQLQAQMYVLKFQIAKAESLYDYLINQDITNSSIIESVADFYRENHRYKKLLPLYQKIIAHPVSDLLLQAQTYGHLGELYIQIGSSENALWAITQYHKGFTHLFKGSPNNALFKMNLAIANEKLGVYFTKTSKLDSALIYYNSFHQLSKELHILNPKNLEFKNMLAVSNLLLGMVYEELGNLNKTLILYEESNCLEKEIHAVDSTNAKFKEILESSYNKLGKVNTSLGYKNCLIFFKESNRLAKELYLTNKSNVTYRNNLAVTYSTLGDEYSVLGDSEKELMCYDTSYRLTKENYLELPMNVDFKFRFAVSNNNLGKKFIELGKHHDLNKATIYFTEFNNLMKQLYFHDNSNIEYKNGLAISYESLGRLQTSIGDSKMAITYYEEETRLFKELSNSYPNNVNYKHGLAIAYSKLATAYGMVENLDKAMFFYVEYNRLENDLHSSFPLSIDFKDGLAISYQYLGIMNTLKGNIDSTLYCFSEYSRLKHELYVSVPSNVYYKNGLASSYAQIGNFYIDKKKDKINARIYFEKCKSIWAEMAIAFPDSSEYKNNLLWATQNLSKIIAND